MITIEHGLNYIRCYSWRGYEFKPTGKLRSYLIGNEPPNYPVPAIPTRVEYIFQGFAIDGVFVRVDDYLVAGAYRDGTELICYPCVPYSFDYLDF